MRERAIIVAGYPKSGNTWIARLTAELVGCPVAGFWRHPEYEEIAVEGADRQSPDRCYKAHHSYPDLCAALSSPNPPTVIYIVRDPRDVAISGSHYFTFGNSHIRRHFWLRLKTFALRRCGLTRDEITKRLLTQKQRQAFMIEALLDGDATITEWCRAPWAEHVASYQNTGIPFVRYEDMRANPERECARIIAHLGLERDAHAIRAAIEHHAFQNAKERYTRQGETEKAAFLRQGQPGGWRTRLTPAQQALFRKRLAGPMRQLNYDV